MGYFEKLLAQVPAAAAMEARCIDRLEQNAFERGLPEKKEHAPFNLPAQDEWPAAGGNAGSCQVDKTTGLKPVILLVDDEEPFRTVIRRVLVNAGYEVVEAADGLEGIQRFYEKPADLIITDIIMPEKEGIETILELKSTHPELKLIAMSGGGWYGTDIDFNMARKLGARTLDKPFALKELLEMVAELLS